MVRIEGQTCNVEFSTVVGETNDVLNSDAIYFRLVTVVYAGRMECQGQTWLCARRCEQGSFEAHRGRSSILAHGKRSLKVGPADSGIIQSAIEGLAVRKPLMTLKTYANNTFE